MIIHKILEREEGFRANPYRCSNGYPTVGIGQKIGGQNDPLPNFVMPKSVAIEWLECNIRDIREELAPLLTSTEARQAILISMAYQMGVSGLRNFKKFLSAYASENWSAAAEEMMDSKWAKYDSLARALRHQKVIITGSIEGVY